MVQLSLTLCASLNWRALQLTADGKRGRERKDGSVYKHLVCQYKLNTRYPLIPSGHVGRDRGMEGWRDRGKGGTAVYQVCMCL